MRSKPGNLAWGPILGDFDSLSIVNFIIICVLLKAFVQRKDMVTVGFYKHQSSIQNDLEKEKFIRKEKVIQVIDDKDLAYGGRSGNEGIDL